MRPRLLDLCCGGGGAAEGYHRVGFGILGVDIWPQPNYPFEFTQMDALDFLRMVLATPRPWTFEAVHASFPCHFATDLRHRTGKDYPDLVTPGRELLKATGLPYVIENVEGSPLRPTVVLCGSMFGLGAGGRQLRRHRLFETNFPIITDLRCRHEGQPIGVYGTGGGGQMTRGYKGTPDEYREAMGIDWATRAEIAQAIPPAYTEHIGGFLMAEVMARREAAA
jgi:DNA (cytosine-5)-methyltransferase 1